MIRKASQPASFLGWTTTTRDSLACHKTTASAHAASIPAARSRNARLGRTAAVSYGVRRAPRFALGANGMRPRGTHGLAELVRCRQRQSLRGSGHRGGKPLSSPRWRSRWRQFARGVSCRCRRFGVSRRSPSGLTKYGVPQRVDPRSNARPGRPSCSMTCATRTAHGYWPPARRRSVAASLGHSLRAGDEGLSNVTGRRFADACGPHRETAPDERTALLGRRTVIASRRAVVCLRDRRQSRPVRTLAAVADVARFAPAVSCAPVRRAATRKKVTRLRSFISSYVRFAGGLAW
jgi:hypothetical protein